MLFLLLNFDPGSDLFVQGGDGGAHHLLSQCLPCTAVASVLAAGGAPVRSPGSPHNYW